MALLSWKKERAAPIVPKASAVAMRVTKVNRIVLLMCSVPYVMPSYKNYWSSICKGSCLFGKSLLKFLPNTLGQMGILDGDFLNSLLWKSNFQFVISETMMNLPSIWISHSRWKAIEWANQTPLAALLKNLKLLDMDRPSVHASFEGIQHFDTQLVFSRTVFFQRVG